VTLQELINMTRYRLSNFEPPYLWVDAELVLYCNEAINTLCREALILSDSLTASVCEIHTSSGTADYALASSILYVRNAKVVTEELLILSVAPSTAWSSGDTITGVTSGVTCKVVSKVTDYRYSVEQRTGSFTLGEILSNGTYTADQGATYPKMVDYKSKDLEKHATMTMDYKRAGWRTLTEDEPEIYILDFNTGYLTLSPSPDDTYLIRLEVSRYPITAMTSSSSLTAQTPEVSSYYHNAIIDGICAQAYLKSGEFTFDAQKSQFFNALFQKHIMAFKKQLMYKREEEIVASPNSAFI
jgi:hypothetical protein